MANNDVKIVITGQDISGSKALRGVREEADHASRSFGGLKSAVGLASGALAGLSVGAGLAGAVKAAGNLQQAVANISTIKPEINTAGVFASLNEMQRRVPQSASQLASSLYDIFSSMDVGQDAALRLTETFAKGATAASTDAQTFGTAIMGVMNAYGASVEDAAHISDVFFNTVNRGVVTGQELASSLGPVTQSAKAAGVSIDELGALIAGVTKEGGPAAQNINNLNNFLAKVSTKEAREEIAKLGVATTDSAGNFRPIVDVLTDLKPRLERMTEAQRANALQAIFPDAQARQGAMTLLSQLDAVKGALAANRESSGSTEAAYAKMAATFNSQLAILKNTAMSVLTQLGAGLLPHITPLITAFAQHLPGAMAAASGAFERAKPVLVAVASAIAGAVVPAAQALGQALAGLWREDIAPKLAAFGDVLQSQILPAAAALAGEVRERLMPVFERLSTFIGEHKEILAGVAIAISGLLVAAFAAWAVSAGAAAVATLAAAAPVLAIGAALAALGAGVIYVVQHWDQLTERFPALGVAVEAAGAALSATWDFIRSETGALVEWWTGIWPDVQEAAANVWHGIQATAEGTLSVLTAIWRAAGDDITAILGALWAYIGTTFENIKSLVQNVVELVVNLINGDWSAAWDNAKEIVGAFVSQVKAYVIDLPAAVAPHLLALAGKFISWIADDVLPKLGGALTGIVTAMGRWIWDTAIPWAGAQMAHIGGAIVDGIKAGISAAWDAFTGWLSGMLAKLPGPLKHVLGISSPSRVMADEIGVPIVQGIMAGIDSKLPDLEKQLRDLAAAIARTRLDLAGVEVGSARAKQLQHDLKILEAWKKQLQDQITIEKEWQQSLADSATALDHFNNRIGQLFSEKEQARRYGAAGAGIVQSLLDALEDPAAGARVAEAFNTLLNSDAFKNLPGAAALGEQLEGVLYEALAEGTPEAFARVLEMLGGVQAQLDQAGTLSGATFAASFNRALAAEDNLDRYGQTGTQLIDAFMDGIAKGGAANIDKAGKYAADLMDQLRDMLPPKEAGKIGAEFFAALTRAAEEQTPEAVQALKDFVAESNAVLKALPKGVKEMTPELREAILAIIALFREGKISAEEMNHSIDEAVKTSEEKAREAKKKADEAKRKSSGGSGAGFTPLPESSDSFEDIAGGRSVRGTTKTNTGGFAGLGHTTLSEGDWQVELFSVTAALLAASSQFLAAAKKGALPGGTDLSAALGFTSGAAYKQWAEVMKEQADATAMRWGAAGREAKGEWGGGVLGGMSDSEFDAFLGTLGTGAERDRARAEREQAQREQTGAARTQEKAADWQVQAAESNKKSAASIEATGAVMNEAAKESRRAAEEARKAAEEARQKDDIDDAEDDEEERERRRRRRREEENRDNPAPGNAPGVPAHDRGGVITEFARLVNAAGRTIGTMSESGPEAIVPMPLLRGAMAALASGETAPGPSAMQSPVGGAGVAVQIGHAVAAALAGMTVEMDGQTVGRLVSPYVSREIARDALLAGVNR